MPEEEIRSSQVLISTLKKPYRKSFTTRRANPTNYYRYF